MICLTYKQAFETIEHVCKQNNKKYQEEEVQVALDMLKELVEEKRKEKYND